MGTILEQISIQLLICVLCLYYGIRMMITKDASMILGKERKKLKNEEEYSKAAGKLIVLFGIASLIMGGLCLVNVYVACIFIIVAVVLIGVLWKNVNKKYGA